MPEFKPYVPHDSKEPEFTLKAVLAGILLAAGPALLRSARPYAGGAVTAQVALDAAPFLLALLYLILLSRRSLRLATPRESRLDPDLM